MSRTSVKESEQGSATSIASDNAPKAKVAAHLIRSYACPNLHVYMYTLGNQQSTCEPGLEEPRGWIYFMSTECSKLLNFTTDQTNFFVSLKLVSESISQSVSQSVSQPVNQSSINKSIKYSFIDKKDNPPHTNASGFYRRVGGGKDE